MEIAAIWKAYPDYTTPRQDTLQAGHSDGSKQASEQIRCSF